MKDSEMFNKIDRALALFRIDAASFAEAERALEKLIDATTGGRLQYVFQPDAALSRAWERGKRVFVRFGYWPSIGMIRAKIDHRHIADDDDPGDPRRLSRQPLIR